MTSTRLGDVVTVKSGFAFKSADWLDAGVPVIKIANVKDGWVTLDGCSFVSEAVAHSARAFELTKGDVLISMTGHIGQVAKVRDEGRMLLNQRVGRFSIKDRERIDGEYLYQWLTLPEVRAVFEAHAYGAAQPNISPSLIEQQSIPLPPLPAQRRIASILSAYDDLIENNTRRIAILEEMARRIYEDWFVCFRFPGHEGGRMVESELGLVPVGWEAVRMEDVCARITDGSHYSPKSIVVGKPMASVKDMHDWGINVETCRQIAEDEYEKLVRNDCKPKLNDVLIAKDGSYLKHTFVFDQEIDLVILSSIAILRPNGRMLPNQLAMYLRLPEVASRMKGYVSGVAIPRIVLRDFRQFLVLLPPAEVQHAWAAYCDPMLHLCRNLVRKNENLRTTRDLLLPKLISGELNMSTLPESQALAA